MPTSPSDPPDPARARRGSWGLWASVLLVLAALGYSVARAARLSITHDEALTFLVHATAPWGEIFAHSRYLASNNHLLNTLLIKALIGPFGSSELVLRTPALLGHALYLAAILRILAPRLAGARLVLATAFLATNPMLLDFFSCARGYGLGLGLATLGLERLLARWSSDVERAPRGSGAAGVGFLGAAVLCNIAFANLFVSATATALGLDVSLRARRSTRGAAARATARALLLPALLASAVLAAVFRPAVLARILPNVTEWGGTRGFWADTVGSLADCVLYGQPYAARCRTAFVVLVGLAVLVSATLALRALARRAPENGLPLLGLVAILVGIALAMEIQHALGRLFALDRSAIYLLPPFLLLLVLAWEHLRAERGAGPRLLRAGHGLALGALTLHGLACLNLSHNFLWRFDATTRDAVHAVRDDIGAKRIGRRYTWGVHWLFEPAIDYYLVREGLGWIRSPDRSDPDGEFDYYSLRTEDRGIVARRGLRVLAEYPLSGALLAKHR